MESSDLFWAVHSGSEWGSCRFFFFLCVWGSCFFLGWMDTEKHQQEDWPFWRSLSGNFGVQGFEGQAFLGAATPQFIPAVNLLGVKLGQDQKPRSFPSTAEVSLTIVNQWGQSRLEVPAECSGFERCLQNHTGPVGQPWPMHTAARIPIPRVLRVSRCSFAVYRLARFLSLKVDQLELIY